MKPRATQGYYKCERCGLKAGEVVEIGGWKGRLCEECARVTRQGAMPEKPDQEVERYRQQQVTWENRFRGFAQRGRVGRR